MPSPRTAHSSDLRIALRKRILKDVPPLRFGEGRECTLPACVAVATGQEYDWVLGASGAAFTTTIDMKDLVIDRILESLESKVPPLARGLVGPAEYGLLIGCDDDGPGTSR